MITILLPLVLPLLLATLTLTKAGPQLASALPWVGLPVLLLATQVGATAELPWLLVGARFGVDAISAPLLVLTALLWTAAGGYARGYLADDPDRVRFDGFYLLTLAGNIGTLLALDMVSFYCFFTLMTFAAYGLIAHSGTPVALRAGKIYLGLALVGEVLLLAAMVLIGAEHGNADLRQLPVLLATMPNGVLISTLTLTGFAIKLGLLPLHVWLPLAHPAAPLPASALLSGVLIKLGLFGWLRFLPLGELALPTLGELCLVVGLASTFYGALVGLAQRQTKTVLAYSSISQMGLVTILFGIGLGAPQQWPALLAVILLFSLHHGLAKAGLFLALGALDRRWRFLLLLLPALALIGAPLTSGALAKLALKAQLDAAPWPELATWLNLSSLATGLLMARLLYLAWPDKDSAPAGAPALALPCLALLVAGFSLPWWWLEFTQPALVGQALQPQALIEAARPVLISLAAALAVGWLWRLLGKPRLWLLPNDSGDILAPVSKLLTRAKTARIEAASAPPQRTAQRNERPRWLTAELWLGRLERGLSGGIAVIILVLALFLLLIDR